MFFYHNMTIQLRFLGSIKAQLAIEQLYFSIVGRFRADSTCSLYLVINVFFSMFEGSVLNFCVL